MQRTGALAFSIFVLAGCGGADQATSPPPAKQPAAPQYVARSGELSDPLGDALQDSALAAAPDLVSARITVNSDGMLLLTARFAPATLDSRSTVVVFYVDTDQNPNTGVPGTTVSVSDASMLGLEYVIQVDLRHGRNVTLYRCLTRFTAQCEFSGVGAADVVGDEVRLGAPLAVWMPGEDGAMNFKVATWARLLIDGTEPYCEVCGDVATDYSLPPGRVQ